MCGFLSCVAFHKMTGKSCHWILPYTYEAAPFSPCNARNSLPSLPALAIHKMSTRISTKQINKILLMSNA